MNGRWIAIAFLIISALALPACQAEVVGLSAGSGTKGEFTYIVTKAATGFGTPANSSLGSGASLTNTAIVAGMPQTIYVSMTAKGAQDVTDPWNIKHRLNPSTGTKVATSPVPQGQMAVGAAEVEVQTPGSYALESWNNGKLIDSIRLTFETPSDVAIHVWSREPNDTSGDAFKLVQGEPIAVSEGAQAVFIGIPVDAKGRQMAGHVGFHVTTNPPDAMAPVESILVAGDGIIMASNWLASYIFMQTGDVTVTLTANNAAFSGSTAFKVGPMPSGVLPAGKGK